jgi:hypothetical protein
MYYTEQLGIAADLRDHGGRIHSIRIDRLDSPADLVAKLRWLADKVEAEVISSPSVAVPDPGQTVTSELSRHEAAQST